MSVAYKLRELQNTEPLIVKEEQADLPQLAWSTPTRTVPASKEESRQDSPLGRSTPLRSVPSKSAHKPKPTEVQSKLLTKAHFQSTEHDLKRGTFHKAPDWVQNKQTWTDEPPMMTQAHTETRLMDWKARLNRRSQAWKARFKCFLSVTKPD